MSKIKTIIKYILGLIVAFGLNQMGASAQSTVLNASELSPLYGTMSTEEITFKIFSAIFAVAFIVVAFIVGISAYFIRKGKKKEK